MKTTDTIKPAMRIRGRSVETVLDPETGATETVTARIHYTLTDQTIETEGVVGDCGIIECVGDRQPRVASEVQRHPSGVEVTTTGWRVTVDGRFAGIVDARAGGFKAYTPDASTSHDSLDAAVSYIVAQQRTPSPERSIERGRDDAEEDSRREAEAVQS